MTTVRRLTPEDAQSIVDCFTRVYGDSYANEIFYDVTGLAEAMRKGTLGCIGALADDDAAGVLLGHMAMTVHPAASVVELGNTVVDPVARGEGLAWKIGAELSNWCRELGYQGFLHYPTTDHHIMQRQSVKAGYETGLMLGYIPAETHGKVRDSDGPRKRQAATIVYEPYTSGAPFEGYLPDRYADLLTELVSPTGLTRRWQVSTHKAAGEGEVQRRLFQKRGLERLEVSTVGHTLNKALQVIEDSEMPCLQIDFSLDDPAVGDGVQWAYAQGFRFCGWLPGFRAADVLRLQKFKVAQTELEPGLENPMARRLLELCLSDL